MKNRSPDFQRLHGFLPTSIIAIGIFFQVPAYSSSPVPDPMDLDKRYNDGAYILDNLDNQSQSSNFAINVDRYGTGHLQSYYESPTAGNPRNWDESMTYRENGKEWNPLSLQGAKSLWGDPRCYTLFGPVFYTFDVPSTWDGEKNLYHLDLRFGADSVISAYRVRGIGIYSPRWISKDDATRSSRN